MSSAEIIAGFSLLVSLSNLFFYYRFTSKSHKPAISQFVENLPTYKNSKEKSRITIKNMGTAQARINAVFLKFSWDKDLQLFLHDEQIEKEENSRKYLAPNEEFVVQKRLPEPPSDTKEYFLTIKTEFDNTWHKEEKFELCRSIEAKKD